MGGFLDTAEQIVLRLYLGKRGAYQAQNNILVRGHKPQGFESPRPVGVVLQQEPVHVKGTEQLLGDGLVSALSIPLAFVVAPADLQGQSYAGLIRKPDGPGKPSAYTVVSRGDQLGRSIRTIRWRYAEWGEAKAAELYDLEKDPREYTNLVRSPEHRAVVNRMKDTLANRHRQAESARNVTGK